MTIATTVAINTNAQMASCDLASNIDLDNYFLYVYSNGLNNDGNGATITLAGSDFIIDGTTVNLNDRILIRVPEIFASRMNGIYVCTQLFGSGTDSAVLTRSGDLQNASQYLPGSYGYIERGFRNSGISFVFPAPAPDQFGISPFPIFYSSETGYVPTSVKLSVANDVSLTRSGAIYNFINAVIPINVTLPTSPLRGDYFRIKNISGVANNITVRNAALATIGSVLAQGQSAEYFFDGTSWQQLFYS